MTNSRGPKLKSNNNNSNSSSSRESSPTSLSNTSDGSLDELKIPKRRSGRGSPRSDDTSENNGGLLLEDHVNNINGKRKFNIDDADGNNNSSSNSNIGTKRVNAKVQKTVTFSDATNDNVGAATKKKKIVVSNNSKPMITSKKVAQRTIGTRSKRGSGVVELLPELVLPTKKKVPKVKKVATVQEDNVTVVKMLTGTLYLHRGDRPRAEFVRFK